MEIKTNAMRIFDKNNISYESYRFEAKEPPSALEAAEILSLDAKKVFKTLVAVSKSNEHYVFMIPSSAELNLKKAAKSVGEKSVDMLRSRDLFTLTGYVHGGCSPVGMKKMFRTVIDKSAEDLDDIVFSAGAVGVLVKMPLASLRQVIDIASGDLVC